jgi:hypothetical protein
MIATDQREPSSGMRMRGPVSRPDGLRSLRARVRLSQAVICVPEDPRNFDAEESAAGLFIQA